MLSKYFTLFLYRTQVNKSQFYVLPEVPASNNSRFIARPKFREGINSNLLAF